MPPIFVLRIHVASPSTRRVLYTSLTKTNMWLPVLSVQFRRCNPQFSLVDNPLHDLAYSQVLNLQCNLAGSPVLDLADIQVNNLLVNLPCNLQCSLPITLLCNLQNNLPINQLVAYLRFFVPYSDPLPPSYFNYHYLHL